MSVSTRLPTLLTPVFVHSGSTLKNNQSLVNVWMIGRSHPTASHASWTDDDAIIKFKRKIDCEIAIQSLAEAGIVDDDGVGKLVDEEFRQICCRDLLW